MTRRFYLTTILSLCLAALLVPLQVRTQAAAPKTQEPSVVQRSQPKMPLAKLVRQAELLTLDINSLRSAETHRTLHLQTRDGAFTLELEQHSLLSPDYYAEAEAVPGQRVRLEKPEITTYKGKIQGYPDSQVRVTMDGNGMEGYLRTASETYFVEPLRHFDETAAANQFAWYRQSDLNRIELGVCGTNGHRVAEAQQKFETDAVRTSPNVNRVVELATESDYEYVQYWGGVNQANAQIISIINQVDGVYEAELGLTFQITYQHNFTSANQPLTGRDANSLLTEFGNYWNQNNTTVRRDIAHLWTGKPYSGIIGLAYVGVVCFTSFGYGLSYRYDPVPPRYILTAHEIGHNFGAGHPLDATPPHAECDRTIMNAPLYGDTAFSFCQFSRDQITGYVAQSGSCLMPDSLPPLCNQFYPVASAPGKTITITGNGFLPGTQVFFGEARRIPAASVTVVSLTEMQVTVPASSSTANINGYLTISVPGFTSINTLNLPQNAANPGSPSAVFPEFVLLGDANRDGVLQTNDITLARAFLMFQATPTARQLLAVDVVPLNANGSRGNGQLTTTDFAFLRAVSFGQAAF